MKKAIILAGGFGTRLRQVVPDVPKPMALVCGKPFLEILLENIIHQGVNDITLSVGYRHEIIKKYFGERFQGMPISYVVEDEPLGTGGALKKSIEFSASNTPVFVFNGDTFIHLKLDEMYNAYLESNADVGMALKPMKDASRYGCVSLGSEGNLVKGFEEKLLNASGLINAGVYILKPKLFSKFNLPKCFSLEQDVFVNKLSEISIFPFVNDEYFIDIGIPEDYERAQSEMISFCR